MTHTSTEQERKLFEAVASDNGKWPQAIERDAKGNYLLLTTANGWMWWQAARRAPAAPVPQGYKITEEQHVAAVKVLHRAAGVDGLPQRMLNAMLAATPQPPAQPGWCDGCSPDNCCGCGPAAPAKVQPEPSMGEQP